MIETRPVIVEGRVLGVVVTNQAGWYFIAADPLVGDLHGQIFPDPDEARRIAGLVLARARALPPGVPILRQPPVLRIVDGDDA